MRLTLPITVRLLAAFALIPIASGCRTPTLQIETPGDVSSYHSWDFAHPMRYAIRAPAPARVDLQPAIAKRLELELAERGFRRTPTDPDLLVYFQLSVREQWIEHSETGAIQHLASLHHAPSYDVQATRTEIRRYEIAELLVVMRERRSQALVWRGSLKEHYRDAFAHHVGEAVSQLVAEIPPPQPLESGRTVIVKEEEGPFLFP